jgi:hypothetical protein
MGTTYTGREAIGAYKRGYVWGTAKECGANDGILYTNESFSMSIEQMQDNSNGLAYIQSADQGKINVTGDLTGFMRYEGWGDIIAAVMGATAVTDNSDTSYQHAFTLDTTNDGKFGTLIFQKKSDLIFEYPSVKFHGLKFAGEMNAPVMITISGIANKEEYASAINTTTTIASVTYRDNGNRVIVNASAYFRINDQSSGALSSSDNVYPASFEFNFNRPVAGEFLADQSIYINEPTCTGFPECTLTLTFPRYNDACATFFEDFNADTAKKIEIYFKGALIAGTHYFDMKIQIPNAKIVDPKSNVGGPDKIPHSLTFIGLGVASAPTGMSGVTTPFKLLLQNERSGDIDSSSSSCSSSSSSSFSSSSSSQSAA